MTGEQPLLPMHPRLCASASERDGTGRAVQLPKRCLAQERIAFPATLNLVCGQPQQHRPLDPAVRDRQ